MPTQEHADRLARLIEATGLAQPVRANFADSRVNVMCRVPDSNSKQWTDIVERFLLAGDRENAWQSHCCRHYFLKEVEGQKKMVWGWNISVQAYDMTSALDIIAKVFRGDPIRGPGVELTEFPLAGAQSAKTQRLVRSIGESDYHPGKSR